MSETVITRSSRPVRHLMAACLGLLLLCDAKEVSAQPGAGPRPVIVAAVSEAAVSSGQTFVATVTPVRTAAVGSAVDGRVFDYPINEGDFVRKGDALTTLLTATINLEIEGAEQELKLREYEYEELKNGSRKEEVAQAAAIKASAKATFEYQVKRLSRAEELFQRGAINAEELQLILSQKIKAEQDFLQFSASYELVEEGPRSERIKQAEAQVGIQKALVEKLRDQLGKHTMRAPFDGFISAEHTELGQWVTRGELVAEVIALDEVNVLTYVPEQAIRYVKLGTEVVVEIPALPNQLFSGRVAVIIPQADVQARTFPVKVRVTNTIDEDGPLIKSGMMARVTLPTGAQEQALLVPKDAIVLAPGQKILFAVVPGKGDEPPTVRPVPVTTGSALDSRIVVKGDLRPGEQVVVRGNDRIRPGQPVAIVEVLAGETELSTPPE